MRERFVLIEGTFKMTQRIGESTNEQRHLCGVVFTTVNLTAIILRTVSKWALQTHTSNSKR